MHQSHWWAPDTALNLVPSAAICIYLHQRIRKTPTLPTSLPHLTSLNNLFSETVAASLVSLFSMTGIHFLFNSMVTLDGSRQELQKLSLC